MYGQPVNQYPQVIDVPRAGTAPLLAKVLGITALGFFVTAFGVATAPVWSMMPGLIAVLILIFAINGARRKSESVALGLFLALAYFMGWEIAPIIGMYLRSFGPSIVLNAALTTGAGMAAMACVSYLFSIDYRRVSGIATAALFALIIVGIASMFLHFMPPTLYSWLALGIFTLLTVADFARIRAGGDGMSATQLSVGIYLDAINIFLILMQLFSGRSRRD
ncbi:MAG: Bax inhibitor-1/YccA family protein [Janthinobacterium lividum]